jgi:hypothetical protein
MNMPTRILPVVASLSLLLPGPVLGQSPIVKRNQFTVDLGPLELGLGYGERVGTSRLSLGGGVWAAWEPQVETFDGNFFEPRGLELFARYQISRSLQAEAGPSLLRYASGDDCSNCGATFLGLRVAAFAGGRRLLFGPAIRYGGVVWGSAPGGMGFVYGLQLRLFFDWDQDKLR